MKWPAKKHDQQEHDHSDWEAVVAEARSRLHTQQQSTVERFGLSTDNQYFWSMEDATMTFSRGGSVFVTARLTMIGGVSYERQTWLWSWANEGLDPLIVGDMDRVRQYGEDNGFPVLPWNGFRHHPELVLEARAVAAAVLDAEMIFTGVLDDYEYHFLLHDMTAVAPSSGA